MPMNKPGMPSMADHLSTQLETLSRQVERLRVGSADWARLHVQINSIQKYLDMYSQPKKGRKKK